MHRIIVLRLLAAARDPSDGHTSRAGSHRWWLNPWMQSPDGQRRLSLERIEAAAGAIDAVFLNTPQFEPEPL